MSVKIVIALNTSWNLFNFRAALIQAMVAQGYRVVAVAPPDEYSPRLPALGCHYVPLPMDNQGTNPFKDFLLMWRFFWLLRRERPSVLLSYTVKPNVYGGLAAHALNIPVIQNVAGLGAAFIRNTWLTRLVKGLYRLALSRSARVFFQNEDDRSLFIDEHLVRPVVADRLPGSGVDLDKFRPLPLPGREPIRFLLMARLLWDKGVAEFVEAARLLRQRGVKAECCLLGFLEVQNPAAVPRQQVERWVAEGAVQYLGVTDDVRAEIAKADCVVLPSYREGTPRSLLEAAGMARPIITTNAPGCRDVVEDGVNGLLCRSRDALDLADKMGGIAALTATQRTAMGLLGREKVSREFDERLVIERYLLAIRSVVGHSVSD